MREDVLSVFQDVVDLSPSQRAGFYRRRNVPDDIRQEVESLLKFDTEADSLSTDIAASAREMLDAREGLPQPEPCGSYRLLRSIGEGGMGSVYLGERADGEVDQRVAVKIVRPGADTPLFRARFLRERRILASLNHPGIARLLDAGHTGEGRPYLVMEYIEGAPIDEYCDGRDLRTILELFLQACDAVAYAHRNLIIHRDLKPSNILIDSAGQMKLLDFGIARILDGSDETRTLVRALTPGYASPEQIRGGAHTTATDIYSLGAVLYRVLTGEVPHFSGPESASVIAAPSHIKPGIPRDIDFIVLTAMRRDPEERYPSINAFADDVVSFLQNRPVRARAGNVWYRTRKFLRRYWVPATAAALVALSLGGGLVIANRERGIAERRFSQVRTLANNLFALDAEIKGVPGTTQARHKLVSVALGYLERLGQEARGDPGLAFEIGSGYLKVARVQGVPIGSNLGQLAAAEESLRKADTLMEAALAALPHRRDALLVSAEIAHDRMILAQTARRNPQAAAFAQRAASRLDRLLASGGPDRAQWSDVEEIYANIALAYSNMHDLDAAVLYARRATEASRHISAPGAVGGPLILANALRYRGDLEEALKTIRAARARLESDPDPHLNRINNLIVAIWREGRILGEEDDISMNRPREAIGALQTAFHMSDDLLRRDAADYLAHMRLAGAGRMLADLLRSTDPQGALEIYDYALKRSREVKNEEAMRDQVRLLAGSSYALRRLGRAADARQRIDQAFDLLRQMKSYPAPTINPGQEPAVVLCALADHYAGSGRLADAVNTYKDTLDKITASHPFPATDLRHAYALSSVQLRLAALERRIGQGEMADTLDRVRRETWLQWQRKLPNNEFVARQLSAVSPEP